MTIIRYDNFGDRISKFQTFQPLVEQTADKVSKIRDTIIKGAGGIFSRGSNVSYYLFYET